MRLARWCHGFGPLGWALDNAEDTLDVEANAIVGFDVTEFLENGNQNANHHVFDAPDRIPIDGRRVVIFMDEFLETARRSRIRGLR